MSGLNQQERFAQRVARKWMNENVRDSMDPETGEVNCTHLAESCCDHFDANNEGGPLDDPDHWIWDLAFDIATEIKFG